MTAKNPHALRCSAHRTDGSPCRRWRVMGATVCPTHGGRAPQVRRKAAQRILEASDAAAAYLVRVVEDDGKPDAIRLAAARDLLDRAGLSARQQVELEVGPVKKDWTDLIPELVVTLPVAGRGASATGHLGELTAEVVPPSDSQEAHDAAQAARRAADPLPPNWVERRDGPSRRQGKKR